MTKTFSNDFSQGSSKIEGQHFFNIQKYNRERCCFNSIFDLLFLKYSSARLHI